jgi:hypothetical protein
VIKSVFAKSAYLCTLFNLLSTLRTWFKAWKACKKYESYPAANRVNTKQHPQGSAVVLAGSMDAKPNGSDPTNNNNQNYADAVYDIHRESLSNDGFDA